MDDRNTYERLKKQEKLAMDMLDVETLEECLTHEAFDVFITMYDCLCNFCKDGMIMNDDYMQCLIYPFRRWGSKASTVLAAMRKEKWDKIKSQPRLTREQRAAERKEKNTAGLNVNPSR